MFYENQPFNQKEDYKKMLAIIGNLTNLFSENKSPYLPYRVHENIFCKYFEAENLARKDCSADAKKDRIGIGLKTWVGRNDQKIAEFGKLRETFDGLSGLKLVKKISEYRNERIRVTKNLNGIDTMIYHIVKRVPGSMQIFEHAFEDIDINNLTLLPKRGNSNNTYFTDGRHTYHFSKSKNTLYMIFENCDPLDTIDVKIMDDPYNFLMNLMYGSETTVVPEDIVFDSKPEALPKLCLRLYSVKPNGTKFVAKKSGLNQWNGVRTSNYTKKDGTVVHREKERDVNELYIPYPAEDRARSVGFFPGRGVPFNLTLPDGTVISAQICQADGKAIMSNPNNALGKWLLRTVFALPEKTLVTYKTLEKFGVDSVVFTKHNDLDYSVQFADIGTYEEFNEEE